MRDLNGVEFKAKNGGIVTEVDGIRVTGGIPEGYRPVDVEALIDYAYAADILLKRDNVDAVDRLAFESICDEPTEQDVYDAAFNAGGLIHGIVHSYLPRVVVEARR